MINAAPQPIYAGCTWHETDTLDYSLEICENHEDVLITDWIIRGSALGPTGGLSARQLNSCLPRREEKSQLDWLNVPRWPVFRCQRLENTGCQYSKIQSVERLSSCPSASSDPGLAVLMSHGVYHLFSKFTSSPSLFLHSLQSLGITCDTLTHRKSCKRLFPRVSDNCAVASSSTSRDDVETRLLQLGVDRSSTVDTSTAAVRLIYDVRRHEHVTSYLYASCAGCQSFKN